MTIASATCFKNPDFWNVAMTSVAAGSGGSSMIPDGSSYAGTDYRNDTDTYGFHATAGSGKPLKKAA